MNDMPSVRREQILGWLRENQMMTIDDLVDRLGVSVMTVHRDLDALVQSGMALKVHGGVRLATMQTWHSAAVCALCQGHTVERTSVVIRTKQGETLEACCPHCGLLLLYQTDDVVSALAKDFIYGRMVNCWQASYLVECEISLCCVPAVLCFASEADALRFQMGFGGTLMDFDQAQNHLVNKHRSLSHHH